MIIATATRFYFERARVTLCSRKTTAEIRLEYNDELRTAFRDYAVRILLSEGSSDGNSILPDDFGSYQIHHIKPIALGGNNNFHNLSLVHPSLHQDIHREIELQTSGMKHGDNRTIMLPVCNGHLWRLEA